MAGYQRRIKALQPGQQTLDRQWGRIQIERRPGQHQQPAALPQGDGKEDHTYLLEQFAQDVDRMPPEHQSITIAGYSVPMFKLDPFQASSALKVEWALRSVIDAGLHPVANADATSNESVTM
jgi:hypothetical protein